jgi:hypothetical protein
MRITGFRKHVIAAVRDNKKASCSFIASFAAIVS